MARRKKRAKKLLFSRHYVRATCVLVAAVGLSLLASRYWLFDLFSNFKLQYAMVGVLLAALLFLSKRRPWAALALAIAVWQGVQLFPLLKPNPKQEGAYEDVSVLQYNVRKNNDRIDEISRWIISLSENVDVVVLSEVNERWETALQRIKWAYPYYISQELEPGNRIVVLSKLLVDELEVKNLGKAKAPVIVMRGETSGYEIPFVIYSAYAPAPILKHYAASRNDLLTAAAQSIAKEAPDYKLLVGDLNITRFSPWFKTITQESGLRDSNEGLGLLTTWPGNIPSPLGITIDHSLISKNIRVAKREVGPAMGSDHLPVVTTFEFKVPQQSIIHNITKDDSAAPEKVPVQNAAPAENPAEKNNTMGVVEHQEDHT